VSVGREDLDMTGQLQPVHGVIHAARQAVHEILVGVDHHSVHLVCLPWPGQQQREDRQTRQIPVPPASTMPASVHRY
jgi:hypothetical protein